MNKAEKDIEITPEEINKIQNALKDEKFRKMFFDYCQEISDPENRAKYELEIQQLEKERGFDAKFVKPEAGHVIKAIDTETNKKVFINVCTSKEVPEAKGSKGTKVGENKITTGEDWSIPQILNKPRNDVDKAGRECQVCDVMVHPNVYEKAKTNKDVMNMLNSIALETAEEKFKFSFDHNNVSYPKLKYKGKVEPAFVRTKDSSGTDGKVDDYLSKFVKYPEVTKTPTIEEGKAKEHVDGKNARINEGEMETCSKNKRTVPRYKILHRGQFDMQNFTLSRNDVISTRPAELCIEVELPAVKSADAVDLDVFEKKLVLTSEKPSYHLEVDLPYPVDEERGSAKFNKARKVLNITLPVIQSGLELATESVVEEEVIENGLSLEEDKIADLVVPHKHDTSSLSSCVSSIQSSSSTEQYAARLHPIEGSKEVCTGERYATNSPLRDGMHCGGSENGIDLSAVADSQEKFADCPEKESIGSYCVSAKDSSSCEESSSPTCQHDENQMLNCDWLESGSLCGNGSSAQNGYKEINTVDSGRSGVLSPDEEFNDHLTKAECGIRVPLVNEEDKCTKDDAQGAVKGCERVDEVVGKTVGLKAESTTIHEKCCDEVLRPAEAVTVQVGKDADLIKAGNNSKAQLNGLQERPGEEERSYLGTTAMQHESGVRKLACDKFLMKEKPPLNHSENMHAIDNECFAETSDATAKKGSEDASDGEDASEDQIESMSFALDGLADVSGMNQLPPFDYDQDEESVTVNINLPDVKVEDISLGFTSRKVYFSMLSSKENGDPVRWCLLIKFLEYCRLDKEICNMDVQKEGIILSLPKTEASYGLWHRLYIGTSEASLEELFFMTDHSMSELLSRRYKEKNPWNNASEESLTQKSNEVNADVIERKLEQLLREQEYRSVDHGAALQQDEIVESVALCDKEDTEADSNMLRSSKESKEESREATASSSSDMIIEVSLDDLHNDVILECDSSVATPEDLGLSRQPVERSHSDDSALNSYPTLRSILKRSQSESANVVSGHSLVSKDYGALCTAPPSSRLRSQSLNVDTRGHSWGHTGRSRNKSVSFDPEPKVCEFVEYSKKQLKKMRKHERKQNEIAAKKEAAAKRGGVKHKGGKGGRNGNFFNGFRKDSSRSENSITDAGKDGRAAENLSGQVATLKKSVSAKTDAENSDSVSNTPRNSKNKKKVDRKEDRALNRDIRMIAAKEQLTNSLIYELDD